MTWAAALRAVRDTTICGTGLYLMIHEGYRQGPERPSHVAGYLAMMGLVAVLRRPNGGSPSPGSDTPSPSTSPPSAPSLQD